jgi:hypothetical protein
VIKLITNNITSVKYLIILLVLAFLSPLGSACQIDTIYIHLGEYGISVKDSATSVIKLYKDSSLWHGKEYYINTNVVKSEGFYRDSNWTTPTGTFRNYAKDGTLTNISVLDESSNLVERTYFFRNGNKRSQVIVSSDGTATQKCWDSLGNEVSVCKVEGEAFFKGGIEGWQEYLQKNLYAGAAIDAGAPVGTYMVKVSFVVGVDGKVSHVHAYEVPELCIPCGKAAEDLILKSPDWEPANLNGEPVTFTASQTFAFDVLEVKKKQKKKQ